MKFDLKLLEKYVDETTMCCEKHPGGELNLYGYYSDHITKQPTVWDEVSKHCRGLILDSEGNIIERPFPKFWGSVSKSVSVQAPSDSSDMQI